jgi:N-acetylglucosamine kinase-like BadF-type ATPase
MIKHLYNWMLSGFMWLLVKENRAIGLVWTKRSLDLFDTMSQLTKTTKDDKVVAYLERKVEEAILLNNQSKQEILDSAAKKVTEVARGALSSISLSINNGKPRVTVTKRF